MKKIKQWRNKKGLLIFSRLYQSIELSFRRPWHCYRLLTGYKFKVYVAPKAWGDKAVIIQRRNENELKVRKSFGGFHSRSLQASLALSILQIFRGPLAIWELGLKNGSYAKVNCFPSWYRISQSEAKLTWSAAPNHWTMQVVNSCQTVVLFRDSGGWFEKTPAVIRRNDATRFNRRFRLPSSFHACLTCEFFGGHDRTSPYQQGFICCLVVFVQWLTMMNQ